MATNVAERATVPAVTALPPTPRVRFRANAVVWGWRAFLTVVYLLLFGPLVILMLFSVNDSNVLAFPLEGVTFHWYTDAFHDELLHSALVNSIVVACIVAPICLVLGTLTAFGITRFRFRARPAVSGLVGAPLILPWLIIGIAALMFYVRFNVDLSLNTVIATQIVCTFPLVTAIVGAQLFRFQQTFPVWVYSSVRNPDHTAIVNAISTVISIIQVGLLTVALLFLRARSGDDATRGIIAGGEAVAASAET
jgi:ABC-type spermidine/putrescine transport system permease subunit II